jgi:DNA polymerase-3 subunit alpha
MLLESIASELEEDILLEEPPLNDNDTVILGGILTDVKQKVTRNNTMMAFLVLEDLTGSIEVIVFPRTLDKLRNLIEPDSLVKIRGRVNIKEDELPKLICESIEGLEKMNGDKIYIRVENEREAKKANLEIKELIVGNEGNTPIYLFTEDKKQKYRLQNDRWITLDEEVMDILKERYGEDNIKLVEG